MLMILERVGDGDSTFYEIAKEFNVSKSLVASMLRNERT